MKCEPLGGAEGLHAMSADEVTASSVTPPWRDAEERAARHMRQLGFADAKLTGSGTDGGIDVVATDAIAQVKHYAKPVGIAEVQRMRGAAIGDVNVLFYSSSGYTSSAIDFAERAGMALFEARDNVQIRAVTTLSSVLVANGFESLSERIVAVRDSVRLLARFFLLGQTFAQVLPSYTIDGELRITKSQLVSEVERVATAPYAEEFGFEWLRYLTDGRFMATASWLTPRYRELNDSLAVISELLDDYIEGAPASHLARIHDLIRDLAAGVAETQGQLSAELPTSLAAIPVVDRHP